MKAFVYKIVSPIGRIYIGSTVSWNDRLSQYRNLTCKGQIRLYNSFVKYGVTAHEFTIIERCEKPEMRKREAHYGILYDCLSENGLNCNLPKIDDAYSGISESTREKMSAAQKGRIISEESRKKMSIAKKGKSNWWMLGKKLTDEQKKNLSEKAMGRVQRRGPENPLWRKKLSQELKDKISAGLRLKGGKPVLCLKTGIFYKSATEAAQLRGMCYGTLRHKLNEYKLKNDTGMIYV